jgi:hypothetical protein
MGEKIMDDNGPLSSTSVKFLDSSKSVDADAVVLAFDDAPPADSVTKLLKSVKGAGVGHVVLLSRLGATKSGFGNKWGPIEAAAIKAYGEEGLSILRVGNPIEGGPYYEKEPDTIKWSSARSIEGCKVYKVAAGDELSQGGVGSPRGGAANGIAALLRRGPEKQLATYCLSSEIVTKAVPATTPAQLDDMVKEAGGPVASSAGGKGKLTADMALDEDILKLTLPSQDAGPGIIDILFNSPPAVSGQYWGVFLIVGYGLYITTTPDYIAQTGVDLWR